MRVGIKNNVRASQQKLKVILSFYLNTCSTVDLF